MLKEQIKLIFLAKLAGTPVFDPNGDRVGKIRDAVAINPSHSQSPRILGFVVEIPQRRRIFIPATRVTSINESGVFMNGSLNIRRYQARHGEVSLLEELLDREVLLRDQGKVVIVEDLGMELTDSGDWRLTLVHVKKRERGLRKDLMSTIGWHEIEFESRLSQVPAKPATDEISEMTAQEVAATLSELDLPDQEEIAKRLDDDKLAEVLEEMNDADRAALVKSLEEDRVADVLGEMQPDDVADVLKEVGGTTAEELLNLMEATDADDIRRLMKYEDYSAGGLMTTDPVILDAVFVVGWVIWNSLGPKDLRFDEYPFIFLTLLLSLQASYAAPLILLAQNRQADRDRVTSQEDRNRDERNLAVTEYMVRELAAMRKDLVDEILKLREELGTKPKPDAK